MVKKIAFLSLSFMFFSGVFLTHAQSKIYATKTALVWFDAGKTQIEPIKAKNSKVNLAINVSNGQIACVLDIVDFEFSNQLMQEHFNENYMESDKYPNAKFYGVIENFATTDFSHVKSVPVKGELTLHGKTRPQELVLEIKKTKNQGITIKTRFKVMLADFKIKIPKIMFLKITEEAEITLQSNLSITVFDL